MGVNTIAFCLGQQGTFYGVDGDCVGITDRVPWEKNRQWTELIARTGTALFVSLCRGTLSASQEEELSALLVLSERRQSEAVETVETVEAAEAAEAAGAAEAVGQFLPPLLRPLDWLQCSCPQHWQEADGRRVEFDWYTELGADLADADSGEIHQLPGM